MIEIERKFLLKNLPFIPNDMRGMTRIVQYYADDITRYRKEQQYEIVNYFKQTKEYKGKGLSIEGEMIPVTQDEFMTGMLAAYPRFISKIRYDYGHLDPNIKMSVDKFFNIHLLMLEIEVPYLDYSFSMPSPVQDQIIDEVTGNPNFSNKNLVP